MAISTTFFIVAIVIVAIWLLIEVKRLKHKLWAFFLIGLILFTYISFTVSLKNQDVDLTSIGGVIDAGKLYVAWLGGMFNNAKAVTAYATKQDWNEIDEDIANKELGIEGIDSMDDIWNKL